MSGLSLSLEQEGHWKYCPSNLDEGALSMALKVLLCSYVRRVGIREQDDDDDWICKPNIVIRATMESGGEVRKQTDLDGRE